MKFNKDDVVVHDVYGVGKVLGVEELNWMQPGTSMFYAVEVGDAKIWVPVEKNGVCNLRFITPKEDLSSYKKLFDDTPAILDEDRFGRTAYISQNKKHETFRDLCITVRDMTSHSLKKKLAKNEAFFLERLTHQLIEEWSISAQVSLKQAENEIDQLLKSISVQGKAAGAES
jgi:RNA polymerase-interacting CarD/CdnL/TRCF family regulator